MKKRKVHYRRAKLKSFGYPKLSRFGFGGRSKPRYMRSPQRRLF